MQNTLFNFPPVEPEPQQSCAHPPELQFRHANLFTGNDDLVCSGCNATIAPDFARPETTR